MGHRFRKGEPKPAITKPLSQLLSLKFKQVTKADSAFWNELIDPLSLPGLYQVAGAQIRYLVYSQAGLVAALSFSAATWKVKPRDRFIGWNEKQRRKDFRSFLLKEPDT